MKKYTISPEPNAPTERLLIRPAPGYVPAGPFLMESSAMRLQPWISCARILTIAAAMVTFSVSAFGQSGQSRPPSTAQSAARAPALQPGETPRRLSIDEAVRLGLEQNLGIQIQRYEPQIQDVGVSQARSFWAPQVSATLSKQSQ